MAPASDRSQNGVEHLVEIPPDVFSQEPQDQVAVLLEHLVLPAVTAIRLGIPQVLAFVELHSDAGIRAQQVDLQPSLLVEWNRKGLVQYEPPLGLRQRFQSAEQELLRGAASPGVRLSFGM